MTGVGVGVAVLVGLLVVAKIFRVRRRWARHGGRCGGHGGYGRGYGRGRVRFMRHMISRRLGLRADQSETLDASLDQVNAAMDAARADMRQSRGELAEVLRTEGLDDARLTALLARQEATMRAARDTVVEAVRKVHAQLDPDQRSTLADWVGRGQDAHGGSATA